MSSIVDRIEAAESDKELKKILMDEYFVPVAKKMMENDDEINSVIVAVSQHYSDGATDEIHLSFIPSSEINPTWESAFNDASNQIIKKYSDDYGSDDEQDYHFEPYMAYSKYEREVLSDYRYDVCYSKKLTRFIEKFCKEGASQEDSIYEAYNPFIIVRREKDGIFSIRDIAEIIRLFE